MYGDIRCAITRQGIHHFTDTLGGCCGVALWDGYEDVIFQVVGNNQGCRSVWPETNQLPAGWTPCGFSGSKEACLDAIERSASEPPAPRDSRLGPPAASAPEADVAVLHGPRRPVPDTSITALIKQRDLPDDWIAAGCGDVRLTRAELFRTSAAWAKVLAQAGCHREVPVALLLPRGLDALVAIFAILEAGGAYVPLSPADPDDRVRAVLEDCGASIVLTVAELAGKLGDYPGTVLTLSEMAAPPNELPVTPSVPHRRDLAFIFYTSGTTGAPKGVEGTHEQLVNYALWCGEAFPHHSGEVTFLSAPLFFLGSLTTIFTPLLNGWPIVVAPDGASTDALHALSRTVDGGLLKLTPTHIRMIMARGLPETGLARQLMVGSEPLTLTPELQAWLGSDRRRVVVNHYGLTETHGCFCHWLTGAENVGDRVPIGRPIDNVDAFLVDADGRPVPTGEVGELLVAGPSLGRGYRGRPALTAERWIPNPWGPAGSTVLRTGDLARLDPDGTVTVLGRADRQVKIRGHRVEPAAIEEALRRSAGVREALVLPRTDDGAVTLDAFLLSDDETGVDPVKVKADLAAVFPPPWLPARMAVLREFPVNANGKVDIRALPVPRPVLHAVPADADSARWTPFELLVGQVFCDVLKLGEIGLLDRFDDLGGDSLTAVEAAAAIGQALGRAVPAPSGDEAGVRSYARRIGLAPPADFPDVRAGDLPSGPAAEARRLPLNPAQERNLRNWPEGEWPVKTMPVVLDLDPPVTVADVSQALDVLARRHEALRSRLVRGDRLRQEVAGAPAGLRVRTADVAEVAAVWALVPVDPFERAAEATLYERGGAVEAVRLTVSHVFTDALGTQVLERELGLLLRGAQPSTPAPAQPSSFAGLEYDEQVKHNTAHWRELLAEAPRSCTYSGVAREQREDVQVMTVPLAGATVRQIDETSRALGVTPYVLWATATSALVSLVTRQHHHVFRSTYANRFTPAEFGAVAQLAQAAYLPITGTPTETLRERAEQISRVHWSTYHRGTYSANEVIDSLNGIDLRRGALFQPAFELNYLPKRQSRRRPPSAGLTEASVLIDPSSAKADLAVLVAPGPVPVLQLVARRPVHRERSADVLAEQLRSVVSLLGTDPDRPISAIPISAFPATRRLISGHHSGVAIDPATTAALVTSVARIKSCRVMLTPPGRLVAYVTASATVGAEDLLRALPDLQPWWAGAVVPDEIVVEDADGQNSTQTTEASS